jgi:quinoprotein glucose dehydrogenase
MLRVTAKLRVTAILMISVLSACSPPPDPSINYDGPTATWPSYGGNPQSNRYSPLNQVTAENVSQLQVAWTHHSNDFSDGSGEWAYTSLQVTPIVTNDTLYYCSPFGRVFALDPTTGRERWMFDAKVRNKKGGYYPAVCRSMLQGVWYVRST